MGVYADDGLWEADEIIKDVLQKTGIDYAPGRDEIARMFVEYIWNGESEITTDFAPELGLRNLKLIQEDHYDQHMDEDEKPKWKDMLTFSSVYVWYA